MASYNRNGWLDTAMEQVRCKSERKVIRSELLGHLEDKEQSFLDAGMDPRTAAKAAVEAMGDPVEVGKALNQAHPAFFGKLYTLAKVVIILLCAVFLISMIDYVARYGGFGAILQNYPLKVVATDPYECGGEDVIILNVDREPIKLSGYTVKVAQAYWSPETPTGEKNVLEIDVKVSNPRPWARTPLFMRRLEADGYSEEALMLYVCLSNGHRIGAGQYAAMDSAGEVHVYRPMDLQYDNLDDRRYWDSWYFTFVLTGVDLGDAVTLYHPDHKELTMTFKVEVA